MPQVKKPRTSISEYNKAFRFIQRTGFVVSTEHSSYSVCSLTQICYYATVFDDCARQYCTCAVTVENITNLVSILECLKVLWICVHY